MTRESVLKDIKKRIEVYSIKIKGNKKDKSDAFYILMNTQQVIGFPNETFHGIKNDTLELLRNAEIDFDILNGGETSQTVQEANKGGKDGE